jgi:hypothetical protein
LHRRDWRAVVTASITRNANPLDLEVDSGRAAVNHGLLTPATRNCENAALFRQAWRERLGHRDGMDYHRVPF